MLEVAAYKMEHSFSFFFSSGQDGWAKWAEVMGWSFLHWQLIYESS